MNFQKLNVSFSSKSSQKLIQKTKAFQNWLKERQSPAIPILCKNLRYLQKSHQSTIAVANPVEKPTNVTKIFVVCTISRKTRSANQNQQEPEICLQTTMS